MANNYNQVAAESTIKCSQEDADRLAEALNVETDNYFHGFNIEFDSDELYIFAEETGDIEEVPKEALKIIGEIIVKAGLEYLEFGYAYTCSKMRPGEFGGGNFRIYNDGSLVWPIITWLDEGKNNG